MTTGNWSLGSVIDHVTKILGNSVPSALSGTNMTSIVDQEINFVEQFTTSTIDSTAIPEKYQPSICDLVLSKILIASEAQQGGIDAVSIGELSISQGAGGGAELGKYYRDNAIERLKELQRSVRFKRTLGC